MTPEQAAAHRAHHERSGHCGACGQPGNWCQCTARNPCGCRDLHVMGSGIGVDPAEVFTDAPIGDEQEVLW